MASDEEHHECKLKEVVEDEVTANTCSSSNVLAVRGEQAPDITDLGDEEGEPGMVSKRSTNMG